MARHACTIIFLLSSLAMIISAGAEDTKGSVKLFVFGDSFVDTGNWELNRLPTAYVEPYGMTWPGNATGRFSDGYCLTDILASFFNTSVPPAYRRLADNSVNASELQYGVNFGYGGSGFTDYAFANRTFTLQVNDFLALVEKNTWTKSDLENSVGVISGLGNDLGGYRFLHLLPESEISICYERMREGLFQNLKKLQSLGIKKLILNHISCGDNDTLCSSHNKAVQEEVENMYSGINGSGIVILDYRPLLKTAKTQFDESKWPQNKTCCTGVGRGGSLPNICGSTDATGQKLYTLCDQPELACFFNDWHISHRGWVFSVDAAQRAAKKGQKLPGSYP